jgi:hypothetical protein
VGVDEGTSSGTDSAVGTAGYAYAMGRTEAETERLIRQSGFYAPSRGASSSGRASGRA